MENEIGVILQYNRKKILLKIKIFLEIIIRIKISLRLIVKLKIKLYKDRVHVEKNWCLFTMSENDYNIKKNNGWEMDRSVEIKSATARIYRAHTCVGENPNK